MEEHAFPPSVTVERLARALDTDDYDTAASLIADDCVYTIGDKTLIGPEVVESYRKASEQAHEIFDDVGFEHALMGEVAKHTYRIHFFDELVIGGERIVHLSEQDVTVHPDRGVVRIVDNPVKGEREKVDAFLRDHGSSD